MSAAVWQQAFLHDGYGVLPREIRWYMGGLRSPGDLDQNAVLNLPGVTIEAICGYTNTLRQSWRYPTEHQTIFLMVIA
jgi:hypothetical protein